MRPLEQNPGSEGNMTRRKEGIPEYWLARFADTLKQLDAGVQGAFLQRLFQSIVGREVSEEESRTLWEGILARQSQLAEKLGRPVTLRVAALDYFEELEHFAGPRPIGVRRTQEIAL